MRGKLGEGGVINKKLMTEIYWLPSVDYIVTLKAPTTEGITAPEFER